MPGIDPSVITHRLNIDPTAKLVKQKKRTFAPERNEAITEEVEKLLDVGFIKELQYPEWLANVVLVKNPTTNGICVLTSPTSTKRALKTVSHSRGSTFW